MDRDHSGTDKGTGGETLQRMEWGNDGKGIKNI